MDKENQIILYQDDNDITRVSVRFANKDLWLTQGQLVEIYQTSKSNVSEHIKHIFEDGELTKETTVRNFRTVQIEGSRKVEREVEHYNFDMVIALGYRVQSQVQLVSADGQHSGFMSISRKGLRWMMNA